MGRWAFVGALVLATVLGGAAPAVAHTVSGVEPTDYESRILAVRPALAGLAVRLLDLGNRIQLTNTSRADVVVLGYQREPYLRVGPRGVFENRQSPTTFANRAPSETGGDATAAPSWRKIGDEPVARWRDQRTRYEGARLSGGRHVAGNWNIEVEREGAPVVVSGVITYIPSPSPWPWVALSLVAFGVTLAGAWSKQWGRWLAVALALLLASDVMHTIGSAAATHESFGAQVLRVFVGGIVSTVAWIIGAIAVTWLQRNHEGGLVAAGGVGLVIAVYGGVTDLTVFVNSQVPSVFPAVTARAAVALALGLGIGLVAASIAVIVKDPSLRPKVITSPATGMPAQPPR